MSDIYSRWLGIPDHFRPPTYYQLLGISPSELDNNVIIDAVNQRLERLSLHESPSEGEECRRLIQEVTLARDTLLDPVSRQRYDTLTPDAAAPWWVPDPTVAPTTSPMPREGWWRNDVPSSPPPTESFDSSPPTVTTVATEGWWEGQTADADRTLPPPPAAVDSAATSHNNPQLPSVIQNAPAIPPTTKADDWWKKPIDPTERPTADPTPSAPPVAKAYQPPQSVTSVAPPESSPLQPRLIVTEGAMSYPSADGGTSNHWLAFGMVGIAVLGVGILVWLKPWEKTESPSDDTQVVVVDPKTERTKQNDPPLPERPPIAKTKPEAIEIAPPRVEAKVPKLVPMPKTEAKLPPKASAFTEAITFGGHQGGVASLAISRNTKTILSTSDDRNVLQYSPHEATKHRLVHKLLSPGVAVAFCNNDRDAVFCDGCDIIVLDLATQKSKATFENPQGGVRCLAPAPDGSFVLTGATDGTVRWWGVADNKLLDTLGVDAKEHVLALAIAPDARSAVFGLSDGRLCLWDLQKRREVKRWKAHGGSVVAVAFSPDGKRLASAGDDGNANVWQASGTLVKKLAGHTEPVQAVVWCSDGQRLLTGGIDKEVRLWDETKDWKTDWKSPTSHKISSLALDAQDRFVLIGQFAGTIQLLPLPLATKGSDN